jgi:arsenite methyltransferase
VARQLTGETGKVIGIDFSPSMNERARINADKLGFENVEFYQGDIEEMPLENDIADVVVSNCVMNLVPDKERAFSETFRILKQGGHFSISDVVTVGNLPPGVKRDAELFAGCVSGATDLDEYLEIVQNAGFQNLIIQKKRKITVPDEVLEKTLNLDEIDELRSSGVGIYSITLYAEKPQ